MSDTATLTDKERRANKLSDHRYGECLWYAFGAADMRPDLKEKIAKHPKQEFAFAEEQRNLAHDYYMDKTYRIPSVQDAFTQWIESLEEGHENCTSKWCEAACEPNSRCPKFHT